jgi:glycosidase
VASAWTAAPIGPCYYGSYSPLPNLNVRDPATAEYLFSVATQWLSRGADGFRLDSTPAIGEWDPASPTTKNGSSPLTHAFWKTFMQRTKSASAQSVAVAEVFTSDATQLTPFFADGIDLAFDYPVWLGGLYDAFKNGGKAGISTMVSASLAARPAGAAGAIFLDNHDVPGSMSYLSPNGRVADLLGGDPMRLQSAAVLLFGLPSVPFVYYGDEIGLRGAAPAPGATPWSRNPMQWDSSANRGFTTSTPWVPVSADATANVADEEAASTSLLKTYRGLISVRKTSPALMHGDYREIPSPSGAVYAFLRESASPSERVVVLVNFAGSAASTTLDFQALGITSASLCDRLCGNPCNSCALPAAITPSNASAYPIDSSVLAAYGARWLLIQ